MTKPDPTKRLKLIKSAIEINNNKLSAKIFEIDQMLNKKMMSIRVFESYFMDYNKGLTEKAPINVSTFINQQRFLNQIASVLQQEREACQALKIKKDKLIMEFAENSQKIDVIAENMENHLKNKMGLNEKKLEQMNQELFESFAQLRADLLVPK